MPPPHHSRSSGCTEPPMKPLKKQRKLCVVPGCSTGTHNAASPVSFHKFPSQNERREMWMKALGIQSGASRRVCSLHFHENAFERRHETSACAGIRRQLRCDAIPMCSTTASALAADPDPRDAQDNITVSIPQRCAMTLWLLKGNTPPSFYFRIVVLRLQLQLTTVLRILKTTQL